MSDHMSGDVVVCSYFINCYMMQLERRTESHAVQEACENSVVKFLEGAADAG